MRAVLLILILAIVALIAAVATGFIDIDQTRSAQVPDVSASSNGVSARGGQTPQFDVETGSVSVETRSTNVTVPVPTVQVQPAGEQPAANQADGNRQGR